MCKEFNQIFIGDNLTVMNNAVMDNFVGKIRLIYIDPPYNTGRLMSYSDNSCSNQWLQEVAERIQTSLRFLSEDGVIFISIDDNEYAYLKVKCDEIFGKQNFVGTFITNQSKRSNSKLINVVHEYIVCYAKQKSKCKPFNIKRTEIPEENELITSISNAVIQDFKMFGKDVATQTLHHLISEECQKREISWLRNYNNVDENGEIFFAMDLSTPGKPREVNIPEIGIYLKPLEGRGWSSDTKFIELHRNKLLIFKGERPYEKHFLKDAKNNVFSILPYYSRQGKHNLVKLGLRDVFDTPKPVELIKFLIRIVGCKNDLIMDYYAGSGTTAQAVYEVNQEDRKNNHYILIQKAEKVKEKTAVYNACKKYNIKPYISDILKFRIDTFLQVIKREKDYLEKQVD